eukprot:jgi/Botrbrau1/23631/Bobra.55_2s0019.1
MQQNGISSWVAIALKLKYVLKHISAQPASTAHFSTQLQPFLRTLVSTSVIGITNAPS